MGAAQTGRTHDLHLTASRKPKEFLDPWAPSTHDLTATSIKLNCHWYIVILDSVCALRNDCFQHFLVMIISSKCGFLGLGLMERKPNMRLAIASAIAGLLVAGAFFTSLALAHDESEGTPVILRPKDGAVVRGPVTMIVGFKNARGAVHDEDMKATMNDATKQMGQMDQKAQMGQMGQMHGDEQLHGAHLHLIVDSPLPKEGTTVPMDEKHIHLMNSEQTTVLNLAPGKHTLQLIVGGDDHVIRAHAARSEVVTITVQ